MPTNSSNYQRRSVDMALVRNAFDCKRRVVFMHVMKSAGTSFINSLCQCINGTSSTMGFDRYSYGSFSEFETMSSDVRNSICFDHTSMPNADVVGGHYATSTLLAAYPLAQLITLMREPRSRLLSHWLYWRSFRDVSLASSGLWANRVRLARGSLLSFLSNKLIACQIDNVFTRALLWPHSLIPNDDFIDASSFPILLEQAYNRLELFCYIDVVESEDLTTDISNWLGQKFVFQRVNITESLPSDLKVSLASEFSAACLDNLEKLTAIDDALWSFVADRNNPKKRSVRLRSDALIKSVARFNEL